MDEGLKLNRDGFKKKWDNTYLTQRGIDLLRKGNGVC